MTMKKEENGRFIDTEKKSEGASLEVSIKEIVLAKLRGIELQSRLLILSSACGIQFQSEDVCATGLFLANFVDDLKKSLGEVKEGK